MSHQRQTTLKLLANTDGPENEFKTLINYMKSDQPFVVSRFITECGQKLEAKVLTVATATALFHKFCKSSGPFTDYDPYLIATCCLYLAGKIEDNDHLRMRDVINVVHTTLHRDSEPLNLDSEYYSMREAIVEAELFVLRMLKFQTKINHPHKYLLHYLKTLRDWFDDETWEKYPIARTSWAVLQDAYHDPNLVFETDPAEFSIACIQLALQSYGVQVPLTSEVKDSASWYHVLCSTTNKDRIWDITTRLMDVYNRESQHITPIVENVGTLPT